MRRNALFVAALVLLLGAPSPAEAAPKKVELYRTWTLQGSDTLGSYEGTLKITDGGRFKIALVADLVYDGGAARSWTANAWYVFGRIYADYTLVLNSGMAGALSGVSSSQVDVRVRMFPNSTGNRITGRYDGPGFAGSDTASLPGAGYRWSSNVLASVVANHPGLDSDAVLNEAVRQARASQSNRYLNRTELESAARALMAPTSLVPTLSFSTTHPNATLERSGDEWVLTSDTSGSTANLGARAEGTLAFDGNTIALRAGSNGYFGTSGLSKQVPEGYWAERLSRDVNNGTVRETFRLERDAINTLSASDAVRVARRAIEDHVRSVRMHDGDWQDYYAGNWSDLVADGIESDIAAFANPADPELVIYRKADTYTIVGSGPFQLYTEVVVSKSAGQATRVFVEID